jgi:small subunit ribosomal protein S1
MANEIGEIFSMSQIMDNVDSSMKKVHEGDVLKGRVISVTDSRVLVNIGYISDGIIDREELSDNPDIKPSDIVKVNDEIYVYVLDANDEGTVMLSKKRAEAVKIWDDFELSLKHNAQIEAKISEVVNGGVVAKISGIRAFIPASHLSIKRVENLNDYVGKTVKAKVIELDRDKQKVVLSIKELEKRQNELKREELFNTIKKGDIIKGVVSRLAKFGAFVDLGGVDGLVHISELSWKRVNDPSEVVSVGDEVEVYVLSVDKTNNKISLGLRNVNENPWKNIGAKYKVEDVLPGTVTRLTDFGAFVEIGPGVEGLVHVSQISDEHISRPSNVLSVGDKVNVKIIDIKPEEQRMSLSIKDAVENNNENVNDYNDNEMGTTIGDLFKNKLSGLKFDE